MLKSPSAHQHEIEMVTLESLVPPDRLVRFGFKPEAVGLDTGYFTAQACHGLEQRGIGVVMGQGYRQYHSQPGHCAGCAQRQRCMQSANHTKVVVRHVWEAAKEQVDARRLTEEGKRIYVRRKETVERSFADAKQLRGHRYARMRGLAKVLEQCLLAAAQNMEKIALLLARLCWLVRACRLRQGPCWSLPGLHWA